MCSEDEKVVMLALREKHVYRMAGLPQLGRRRDPRLLRKPVGLLEARFQSLLAVFGADLEIGGDGDEVERRAARCERNRLARGFGAYRAALDAAEDACECRRVALPPVFGSSVGASDEIYSPEGLVRKRSAPPTVGRQRRSRFALPTTESELAAIAAAAIIGLSWRPMNG